MANVKRAWTLVSTTADFVELTNAPTATTPTLLPDSSVPTALVMRLVNPAGSPSKKTGRPVEEMTCQSQVCLAPHCPTGTVSVLPAIWWLARPARPSQERTVRVVRMAISFGQLTQP